MLLHQQHLIPFRSGLKFFNICCWFTDFSIFDRTYKLDLSIASIVCLLHKMWWFYVKTQIGDTVTSIPGFLVAAITINAVVFSHKVLG